MKLRKLISSLVAVSVCAAALLTVAFAAEDSATYTLSSTTASAGESVEITLSLENNISGGFSGSNFVLNYDSTYLTLENYQKCDSSMDFGLNTSKITQGSVKFYYCYNDWETAITTSGDVAVLTFAVGEDAPDGEYTITLTEDQNNPWFGSGSMWTDMEITPTVNDGKITVSSSGGTTTTLDDFAVENQASAASATITAPDGGWVEGENTFNVTCDSACVVAILTDGGSYEALTATLVENNTYSFTVADLTADTELVVVVKGDANGDGACDAADAAIAGAYSVGNIGSLSDLQLFLLDINKDDAVDGADSAVAKAVSVGNIDLTW